MARKAAQNEAISLKPASVALVIGVRGAGKSTAARERILRHCQRVVVWDPHREHKADVHLTVEQFAERCDKLLARDKYRIAVHPTTLAPSVLADEFGEFIDFCSEFGGYTLAVDEVGLLLPRAREALEMLATQSRHFGEGAGEGGCPVVFIAQRAVQIPPTARSQADIILSGCQTHPEDLRALGDRCGEAFVATVRTCTRENHRFATWRE